MIVWAVVMRRRLGLCSCCYFCKRGRGHRDHEHVARSENEPRLLGFPVTWYVTGRPRPRR